MHRAHKQRSGLLKTAVARRRILGPVLASLLLAACNSGPVKAEAGVPVSHDPPLLVPWSRIGNIALGESKSRVQREYGTDGHGYHVQVRNNGIIQGYYLRHGGRVFVTFEDGRVNEVDFSTRYYRSKSGFGVGSKIPLGSCHTTATNSCEHRWHGFVWNSWVRENPCSCWVKVGVGKTSLPATTANYLRPWFFIYTNHGQVTRLRFVLKFTD